MERLKKHRFFGKWGGGKKIDSQAGKVCNLAAYHWGL